MGKPKKVTKMLQSSTSIAPVYQIPAPEPFSFKGDDWNNWKLRFTRFRKASGLINEEGEKQVNSLIYLMGERAESILATFNLTQLENTNYDTVLSKFDGYFTPSKNVIYERYIFHTRFQSEDESVEVFINVLHTLSKNCDFPIAYADEAIRDQLVVGLRDKTLSEKLQLNSNLTLEVATKMAKQSEVIKKQQESIVRVPREILTADKVSFQPRGGPSNLSRYKGPPKWNQPQLKQNRCVWCGKEAHQRPSCPARNAICSLCNFKGHFARCCRANVIREISTEDEVDDEVNYIGAINNSNYQNGKWFAQIRFCGVPMEAKIDTGADVCVMPESFKKKYYGKFKLESPKKILSGPNGSVLNTVGVLKGPLTYKGVTINETFYFVSGSDRTLLSNSASERLGMVKRINKVELPSFDPVKMFPELFTGLGKTNVPYDIKLKQDAVPYALTVPRRVPIPLKNVLKEELDRMETNGVIEKVNEPTDWCSPLVIVPKPNNTIRICVDLTRLNENVKRELHPIPSVDHTIAQLDGACIFTELDANSGFWQIPLTKESSKLTTFISPFGRYCFKRMPFGISSAPEVFQKRMTQCLEGIEGVLTHFDNIIIFGKNMPEHDSRLRQVLTRLQQEGWTLNLSKCQFRKESLNLLGQRITKYGILPDKSKVAALIEIPPPTNITELRRIMGIINFMGKFIPHLSTTAHPLFELLQSNREFIWGKHQSEALDKIKQAITSPPCLALYSTKRKTHLSVDSSSYGLGAALLQTQDDGNKRPVAFASRRLTPAERKWAQIEKEGLAIIWGCERFADLITGLHINIETDHKPLLPILKMKELDSITPRLQRIKLKLMRYSYDIVYVPGKQLFLADALSRSPRSTDENWKLSEEISAYVNSIVSNLPASDHRIKEIITETQRDRTLQHIMRYCIEGWPERHTIPEEVLPYWQYKTDISLNDGLLLFGSRIVIPINLRADILNKLHAGHQGITRCRSMAKDSVWWPRLSIQLKEMVDNCRHCAEFRPKRAEPLMPSEFPDRPWQKVGTDLLKCKGAWFLLIADYYSRFFEMAKLADLKMTTIVLHTKSIFARHGVPEIVRADCGSQFDCTEYKRFAKDYGFRLLTSSPTYPQSNGFIESEVKNFKYHFSKCEDPYKMLLLLRATPGENGLSPAEMLMGRKLRTHLPIIPQKLQPYLINHENIRDRENSRIQRQKTNFDKHHGARPLADIPIGTNVYISDRREEGTVIKRHDAPRSYIVKTQQGKYRRNRSSLYPLIRQSDVSPTKITPSIPKTSYSYSFPQEWKMDQKRSDPTSPRLLSPGASYGSPIRTEITSRPSPTVLIPPSPHQPDLRRSARVPKPVQRLDL